MTSARQTGEADSMNTKDLAKQVADQLGTTEKQARELLDAALNAIGQAAAAGDEINLPGFGKFKVKNMSERSGRNPATGEAITIAPSKKLTFTPAKALKDRL
jgi:DNA-binding protein HU-beta